MVHEQFIPDDASDSTFAMNEQEHVVPELPQQNDANTNDQSFDAATHINGPKPKQSGKGVNVSDLLQMLYRDNRFTNVDSWKNVAIPLTLGTPNMATNTLELCQCVMKEEELDLFRRHTFSSNEDFCHRGSTFKAMWLLEGKAYVEREYEEIKKRGNRGKKSTYMGIGGRVRDYKKKVSENAKQKIYKLCMEMKLWLTGMLEFYLSGSSIAMVVLLLY